MRDLQVHILENIVAFLVGEADTVESNAIKAVVQDVVVSDELFCVNIKDIGYSLSRCDPI